MVPWDLRISGVVMNSEGKSPLDMRPDRSSLEDASASRPLGQRIAAWTLSGTVQLLVLVALLWPRVAAPPHPQAALTMVKVADVPKPEPPGPPLPEKDFQPVRLKPPRVVAPTVTLTALPRIDNSDLLSAAQIAGAASADEEGGGGGGGDCNTARRLQQALQRDPLVHVAVKDANRLGQAVMLWNGDWVRSGAQEGKGLSAVREAITWELAFAPASCRNKRMHGLVMLALADGATRFAVGSGDWRWSDLLGLR